MEPSLASWLVIAVAIAFANLPFLPRTMPFVVRLLGLVVLYFLVGLLARLLESRIGNVFAQTWEFYAITGCLFIVLAFPGFVLRYLRRSRA